METNATINELHQALKEVNKKYADNICFNREPEHYKGHRRFTLRVISSFEPGHRLGFSGKKMPSACWHVHGNFIDALLDINPEIWIKTAQKKITCKADNWRDSNIGTLYHPMMYSEACECDS